MSLHPDARLLPTGEVASFEDEKTVLPNYSGLVYALLAGRPYILWLYPETDTGRHWDVINPGSTIVQSALDSFVQGHTKE